MFARRRADTPDPYPHIQPEDMTPAQRIATQATLMERYQGKLDRAQWDREFRRERYTQIVKLRVNASGRKKTPR